MPLSLKEVLAEDQRFSDILTDIGVNFCIRCFKKKHNFEFYHRRNAGSLDLKTEKRFNTTKWFNDVEHGFFHGLCTSIIARFLKLDCKDDGIAVYLYHDLVKSLTGEGRDHDKLLKQYKKDLPEEVYSHSNPSKKEEESLLVKADRLELLRYPDWEEWVDSSRLEELDSFLNFFYWILRPALQSFYEHRNEIWVRHGPDCSYVNTRYKEVFPHQNLCKFKDKEGLLVWPVEIDKIPFEHCSQHGIQSASFNYIRGYILLSSLERSGGKINLINRDHLGYSKKEDLNIENWVFIINKNKIEKEPNGFTENLIKNGIPFIFEETFKKCWKLINVLQVRIETLNHERGYNY